jgi:hypothetical protein
MAERMTIARPQEPPAVARRLQSGDTLLASGFARGMVVKSRFPRWRSSAYVVERFLPDCEGLLHDS